MLDDDFVRQREPFTTDRHEQPVGWDTHRGRRHKHPCVRVSADHDLRGQRVVQPDPAHLGSTADPASGKRLLEPAERRFRPVGIGKCFDDRQQLT